jgi:hypothetical protein
MNYNIKTLKYIPITDLIPVSMLSFEVWKKILENAPFSRGNDHSLVSSIVFANHCAEKLDNTQYKTLLGNIKSVPRDVYIDIEH